MSFRTRLILCFALIVLLPAAVLTLGLTRVAGEWSAARDDAGLTADAETALSAFADKLAGELPEGEGAADIDLPAGASRAMTTIPNGAGGSVRVAVLEPRGSSGF